MAINKRPDARPKSALKKYGEVEFGDPVNKLYPLDTAEHVDAAWKFVHQRKQRAKYTRAAWEEICARIIAAWKAKIDPQGPPLARQTRKAAHYSDGRDADAPGDEGAMQFLPPAPGAPHFTPGRVRVAAALFTAGAMLAALALALALVAPPAASWFLTLH
ncbi:MAG TPA: DUF6582 domain-containing protein [Candidatus Binataceae bacterium]|nr:DUF6582 domain-containing protein [Candidatus Binataceae bacterium]